MLDALDTPPSGGDTFIWTDYIELRVITSSDQCFSRGDLASVERRSRDAGRGFVSETRWREVIDFAGVRAHEFGESYPFVVSEDGDTLSLEFNNEQAKRTYLGLLIAACMRNILNTRRAEVARAFEETCFQVFSKLMPSGSEIRATWANGGAEAPYKGVLYKKMQHVAADLRCTPNFEAQDFKSNDSGDGGIDLIAWYGMEDDREGMPIAFAQCGCSREDWRFKQCEASPNKHYRHLPVMHPWSTYYFLPLDLRNEEGDWAYKSDIGQAIIVDRLRLLRLASNYNIFANIPAMPFIEEARAYRVA